MRRLLAARLWKIQGYDLALKGGTDGSAAM